MWLFDLLFFTNKIWCCKPCLSQPFLSASVQICKSFVCIGDRLLLRETRRGWTTSLIAEATSEKPSSFPPPLPHLCVRKGKKPAHSRPPFWATCAGRLELFLLIKPRKRNVLCYTSKSTKKTSRQITPIINRFVYYCCFIGFDIVNVIVTDVCSIALFKTILVYCWRIYIIHDCIKCLFNPFLWWSVLRHPFLQDSYNATEIVFY